LADSFVQYFTPSAPNKRKPATQTLRASVHRQGPCGREALGRRVKNYNDKKAAGVKNIALVPEALD